MRRAEPKHKRITARRALDMFQALEHWLGEHRLMENASALQNRHVIERVRDALKDHVLADLAKVKR